jgi:hypothetical protein
MLAPDASGELTADVPLWIQPAHGGRSSTHRSPASATPVPELVSRPGPVPVLEPEEAPA